MGRNVNPRKNLLWQCLWGAGSGGQYCRNHVGCMGEVIPSNDDDEPRGVGCAPWRPVKHFGGWAVVAARLASWGCMIGSMPRMSVRAQAHLPWLLDWCERAAWTSSRALAGQRPWWSQWQGETATNVQRTHAGSDCSRGGRELCRILF